MKFCVYTCITGRYDRLLPIPPGQNPQVDFICFTDDAQMKFRCGNWQIRTIPSELGFLPLVKQQRVIKTCPHKYLGEYDTSLWVDGNIQILGDIWNFVSQYDLSKTKFYTKVHPVRKCIYQEADAVIRYKKDIPKNVNSQVEVYHKEGFPKNFGLHETGIILREHSNKSVMRFCNMWAKEIIDRSHRDQLSFDYCRWKTGLEVGPLRMKNYNKDSNFSWRKHGS